MTVLIRLLGRPRVEVDGVGAAPPRGRKAWAILARIVLADRPPTRVELMDELFPDADDPRAALRWSLADARRMLQRPDALRGDPLALTVDDIVVDVDVMHGGTLDDAELTGELLAGIELRDCPAFEAWLMLARSHWAARAREELRARALRAMSVGDTSAAVRAAEYCAGGDLFDEPAQELYLRALVADGRAGVAAQHLALCEVQYDREGLEVSPALRQAAQPRAATTSGVRAGVVAASLLVAGNAAIDAGAADGGIETLRRAADDAVRANDPGLHAEVLLALGTALIHAVRGYDGEGVVVLHRALVLARSTQRPDLAAQILRELAFTDIQAGRHLSAARALSDAAEEIAHLDQPAIQAGLLGLAGMNAADRGRHGSAVVLLTESARLAEAAGRPRQQIWSLGVLARSLLLSGRVTEARRAAEASMERSRSERWTAFLPWPQALHAECRAIAGDWAGAAADAEESFALATELGDPCWEGMAGRAMSIVEHQRGDRDAAWSWANIARDRCDRVSDRYVWVSSYIAQAQMELADTTDPRLASDLAARLRDSATRADLPEFQAWALVHQAADGVTEALALARTAARTVDNPRLHARLEMVGASRP